MDTMFAEFQRFKGQGWSMFQEKMGFLFSLSKFRPKSKEDGGGKILKKILIDKIRLTLIGAIDL